MPLERHESFKSPDGTTRLWRYMSFAKSVSLITTRSLWFANAEMLAAEDPYEGLLPQGNFQHRNFITLEDIPPEFRDEVMRYGSLESFKTVAERIVQAPLLIRRSLFLNCWHASSHESMAMWRVYGEEKNSITITSTLDRTTKAFNASPETIYCGQVDYIDFEKSSVSLDNLFNSVQKKRLSFKFESEVRFVHWQPELVYTENPYPPGLLIECDLTFLIEEIQVSPLSDRWFEEAVRKFVI